MRLSSEQMRAGEDISPWPLAPAQCSPHIAEPVPEGKLMSVQTTLAPGPSTASTVAHYGILSSKGGRDDVINQGEEGLGLRHTNDCYGSNVPSKIMLKFGCHCTSVEMLGP
jgi:hypothetical protein